MEYWRLKTSKYSQSFCFSSWLCGYIAFDSIITSFSGTQKSNKEETILQDKKDILCCDLKNRNLTINNAVISIPPLQFIIYLHYLKKKTSECRFQEKDSCKDCTECFEELFHTAKSTAQLLNFYKQIYGDHSDHYNALKAKLKRAQSLERPTLLQNICKINKKIKSKLDGQANNYIISSVGIYGSKTYGIKHDKKKIFFIDK